MHENLEAQLGSSRETASPVRRECSIGVRPESASEPPPPQKHPERTFGHVHPTAVAATAWLCPRPLREEPSATRLTSLKCIASLTRLANKLVGNFDRPQFGEFQTCHFAPLADALENCGINRPVLGQALANDGQIGLNFIRFSAHIAIFSQNQRKSKSDFAA